MDNNMNVVDYNNLGNNVDVQPQPAVQPQPVPMPEVTPVQPAPMPEVAPVQPEVASTSVQSTNLFAQEQPVEQNVQPINQVEAPVVEVTQTPTEVFGAQVNEQVNDPSVQTIVPPVGPQEAEQPKYGYMTNEDKPNLNSDSNANIKFVIFLAILMLGFIIALPYLSSMIG